MSDFFFKFFDLGLFLGDHLLEQGLYQANLFHHPLKTLLQSR